MSRLILVACLVIAGAHVAHAQEEPLTGLWNGNAPADMKDQAIGATIGLAGGGRVTPGGVRVIGHYLYQLAETDWFDGTAAFTFGSGDPACFRDRMDDYVCDHSLVDGFSAEVGANVRRFFGSTLANQNKDYWPYARLGVGVALVRFSEDDVTGVAIPLHVGGGIRASMSDGVAVTVEATLDLGIGRFSQGLGAEPQLGGSITAGAEFGL